MNLHFVNSTEAWVYFTYKTRTGTFNNEGAMFHDFVETAVTSNGERKYGKHPTQKPESLIQHFVELLSNRDDWVLDPFMGSGTTGVVAKRTERNFIGVELNETYFEMAKSRIAQAKETGCETLVTPCPFCKLNLENDDLEVLDLTEFLVKYGGIDETE